MTSTATAKVRLLGCLHTLRRERGLPSVAEVELPGNGKPAADLATELELPLDRIEAVFINHRAQDLGQLVRPGDEIAFIPHGTPGPHRFTLGIRHAGQKHSAGEQT